MREHFVAFRDAHPDMSARFVRGNFALGLRNLAATGVQADAILLDLGVSSMQIDRPERGFSYATDAPLDMRMDPADPRTAADLVNELPERALADIFHRYGEERYARPIARAIVRRRQERPFSRSGELVDTIRGAIPKPALFGQGHPARRVFQALRIAVNEELDALGRGPRPRARRAAPGRPHRGHLVPLARGPRRSSTSCATRPPAASARPTCPSAAAATSRCCGC